MTPDELETLIEALPASLVVEAAVLRAALATLRRAEAREAERAADETLLRELMVAYRQMGTEEARHDLLSIARALAGTPAAAKVGRQSHGRGSERV